MHGPGGTGGTKRERVWDPLVRIFHWSLVAAFATAWFIRSEAAIHETAGMIVLGLLIFRAAWGIVGTGAARFETFVTGPLAVLRYGASIVRGNPTHFVGHNPAGAAMIGLMMLTLCITAASGILMTTTAFWGGSTIEWIHGASANLMLFLIAGHLAGVVAASLHHRENLPASMIHGYKQVPIYTAAYLGKTQFSLRRLAIAASIVLISTGIWDVSTTLLNASFWRMPKIVTAAAAKQGCAVARVDGPRVEVFPRRSLHYTVSLKTEGAPLQVEIPVELAFEKRPTVELDAIAPECALRNKILLVAAYERMAAARLASLTNEEAPALQEPPVPENPEMQALNQPQPGVHDTASLAPRFAERPNVQERYKNEARPKSKKIRRDRQKRKRKGRRKY